MRQQPRLSAAHRLVMTCVVTCIVSTSVFAVANLTFGAEVIVDKPFAQPYREAFRVSDKSAENDVRAIAVDRQNRVWVATRAGVRWLSDQGYERPKGEISDGPAFDVYVDKKNQVWAAAWDGLYRIVDGRAEKTAVSVPLGTIGGENGRLIVAGPDGCWKYSGDGFERFDVPIARGVTDIRVVDSKVWFATLRGLFCHEEGRPLQQYLDENDLLSCATFCLAVGPADHLWIGSNAGIDVYWQGRRIRSLTAKDGLPCTDITALSFAPDGRLWIGTRHGAVVFDGKRWALRHSRRWLPSDQVRDIDIAADGTAWIATAAGVAALRERRMTLADKAAFFENVMRARHVRPPGLMRRCRLRVPGDVSSFEPTDTDNDGLFTGMYLAAECYRYAVTRDPQAKETATHAFRGMAFLQTVTETPGFVARTVIPSDWTTMADRNRTYTPEQAAVFRVFEPRWKKVENRWRKSRDGRWLWKGDTSSDEISGHYFAYGVYYDLVAEGDEKQRVAEHVRKITDYIIQGGLVLRDIDGKATRWGVWAPEKLNDDPDWQSERGINSIEILSFLNVAHHMTGDKKYRRVAEELLHKHGYAKNILHPQPHDRGRFTFIDAQLLSLAYRGLIAYEPDSERRELYLRSLRRWFEIIRFAEGPMYNFVYQIYSHDEDYDADACAFYLRDVPLDLVAWTIDQSQREDIQPVKRPQAERWQTDRLLPPSERGVIHWDGNPFAMREGEDGRAEKSASFWLLPYWMARHHGLITAPQK